MYINVYVHGTGNRNQFSSLKESDSFCNFRRLYHPCAIRTGLGTREKPDGRTRSHFPAGLLVFFIGSRFTPSDDNVGFFARLHATTGSNAVDLENKKKKIKSNRIFFIFFHIVESISIIIQNGRR